MVGFFSHLLTNFVSFQLPWSGIIQQPMSVPALSQPIVTIANEVMTGTATVMPSSTATVNKFLGIPFATIPTRFAMPTLVTSPPSSAQSWGPACMQQFEYSKDSSKPVHARNFVKAVFGGSPSDPQESEDCLYLNVYTPATSGSKAVMFWIFGGGLKFGHAGQDLYDGSNLAASQDVVVVTINYRTNVFGFPDSPAISDYFTNVGFQDQIMALQWVQDNIVTFGGDPKKVTIFGQSAGSKSVDRLVLGTNSSGLFRAAILQSGTATYDDNIETDSGWSTLTDAVGCTHGHSSDRLTCVQNIDDPTVIKNAIETKDAIFLSKIDFQTRLCAPIDRRIHQKVPIMIGTTGQESRVFALEEKTLTKYIAAIEENYTCYAAGQCFPAHLAEMYPVGSSQFPTDYDAISQLETDWKYQCPAAMTSNASVFSAKLPTWRYYFNASFANTNFNDALTAYGYRGTNMEAFHSSDIAYVFGNFIDTPSAAQIQLSQTMQQAWANFAKDPNAGPGWNDASQGVMILGGPNSGESGFSPGFDLDSRCSQWSPHIASPCRKCGSTKTPKCSAQG